MRKKANPAASLSRFIYGIYDYHTDRGMPSKTAKARMIDQTLEETFKLMKIEQEVPDEMLVLMAQWMSRALDNRGMVITKEIKSSTSPTVAEDLEPLRVIKLAKDSIDDFIVNYTGRSEANGTEEKN